jgi:hypothetical protein
MVAQCAAQVQAAKALEVQEQAGQDMTTERQA